MKRFFVDTNIFLRTLIKEDETSFEECRKFFEAVKLNKVNAVTSHLILAEIAWTLSSYYGFSRREVAKALEAVVNLRGLRFNNDFQEVEAIKRYLGKKVKFIDALIASIGQIQSKEWLVVSYDKDFDKLGVKRVEPISFIRT